MTVRKKHPDRVDAPAIDIQADVKAKAVRFEEEPDANVEVSGEVVDETGEIQPEVEGGSATERENLPDEVEPGVTYRDVRVRWHAAAEITERDD
ncbi:MAG TPA: hypothetical protein VK920_11955 [Solirubrobacterales bacterium]|nr:hypothetical protein [Solirubrobacterales bacterium]